jgi:hypothetical protein
VLRVQEAGLASLARQGFTVADVVRAGEAGPVIFGDPDTRLAELVAILVDAAGRLRAAAGEASGRERRAGSAGAERKDDQPPSETPPKPVHRV